MIKLKHIIAIRHLSKHFHTVKAVDDVTLALTKGSYGLIGPNGAGKTTLIKLICGLIRPTNGKVLIKGYRPGSSRANSIIGYLSENMGYYEEQSPMEYLWHFSQLYGIPKNEIEDRIHRILKKVNLFHRKDHSISTFSRGMRQRLGISRSILHEPELVILDEPLSGLDPSGRKEVLQALELLRKEGHTILLSSHELKDMDTICDQLFVMRTGKIIAKGSPKKLISELSQANEVLTFNLHTPTDIVKKIPDEIPEILKFEIEGDSFKVTIEHNPELERKILKWLLDKNVDFSHQKHVIDSIYTHLFKEEDKK